MSERPPPPLPELEPPAGAPLYVWFEGVIEGFRGPDDLPLRNATDTIARLGFVRADLELDGPRFSLLLSGAPVGGNRIDDDGKKSFLAALNQIALAAEGERPIESTLRCTEVHLDRTVETLFTVEQQKVRALGRVRPISSDDRRRDPRAEVAVAPEVRRDLRRRGWLLGALFITVGVLFLWQQGWIDRLRSVDPDGLPVSAPEFGTRIEIKVERSFANYVVHLSRGPDYPHTDAKLDLWQERLSGARERMAHQAIATGGAVYVHLLGKDSARLRTVKIELAPLVLGTKVSVTGLLPGHPETTGFALSSTESWGR